MKDEELQKIRTKLESSTNVLFEKISEFLIHEITESCEKKKLSVLKRRCLQGIHQDNGCHGVEQLLFIEKECSVSNSYLF